MRLSTIFVSSALMLAGLSAAIPVTEDNMLAARSEFDSLAELDARAFEEELDLFARGNAFSKGSGGDKERKDGNPPKYKVAKKDPPPRYDGPPSPIHFDTPGTNYANNHKSPATGGGRHGGDPGAGPSRSRSRRALEGEDELFTRQVVSIKGGQIKTSIRHRRDLEGEAELFTRQVVKPAGIKGGQIKTSIHHRRGGQVKPSQGVQVIAGTKGTISAGKHRRALEEEGELFARQATRKPSPTKPVASGRPRPTRPVKAA